MWTVSFFNSGELGNNADEFAGAALAFTAATGLEAAGVVGVDGFAVGVVGGGDFTVDVVGGGGFAVGDIGVGGGGDFAVGDIGVDGFAVCAAVCD